MRKLSGKLLVSKKKKQTIKSAFWRLENVRKSQVSRREAMWAEPGRRRAVHQLCALCQCHPTNWPLSALSTSASSQTRRLLQKYPGWLAGSKPSRATAAAGWMGSKAIQSQWQPCGCSWQKHTLTWGDFQQGWEIAKLEPASCQSQTQQLAAASTGLKAVLCPAFMI